MSQVPADLITSVGRDGTPARAPQQAEESNRFIDDKDKLNGRQQQTVVAPRERRSFIDWLCCVSVQEQEPDEEKHSMELPKVGQDDPEAVVVEQDAEPAAHLTKDYNSPGWLLPPQEGDMRGRKTLVLDLDETLVHSSFTPVRNADFVVPVEIEGVVHRVYVLKRPYVDEFLTRMAQLFEVIVYTASLSKYADPVIDLLDPNRGCVNRLFREGCCNHFGNYVKDLGRIGRDLNGTIIIDNSPTSYIFHPENAIPITSWFDDPSDTELLDLIPFLENLAEADDVIAVLDEANQLANRSVLDAYD